jgi:oxygen-independent coproporphyrinogen-3 oxidase
MILEPANELRGSKIRRNRDVQSQVPSIYLHIPFCKRKCNYCDFVSYAGKEGLIDEYVEVLSKEITALTRLPETCLPPCLPAGKVPEGGGSKVPTIFFGGGTPTLLMPKHFEKILGLLKMIIIINNDIEISLESNPGTINLNYLKEIRETGINRLSIGVQSFNDRHLKTLGRIHSSNEAIVAYNDARSAGFDNINLDLMYALPGQTLEEWKSDLRTAMDLNPNHLSIYNLQIEESTPFWHKFTPPPLPLGEGERGGEGKLSLPSEETEVSMFEYTIETLTAAGYNHYEISNFAKPGFECKHNINYWKNGNYIGIGAGAHSHLNGDRWANPDNLEKYMGWAAGLVNGQRFKGQNTQPNDQSSRSTNQQETIFLGLRLLDGLAKENFAGFDSEVKELMKDGLLEEKKSKYKLTRRGLFLGNLVFEKFV